MFKSKLIIYNSNTLFDILYEIREKINYILIKISKIEELNNIIDVEDSNYLLISDKKIKKLIKINHLIIKNKPFNISSYNSSKDSLEMEVLFYIDSGDSSSTNYNLKINDTSRTKILFSNYYSYDDGNAEYAAGLNQKNSELVLKYNILKEDTLTQIMILFPES